MRLTCHWGHSILKCEWSMKSIASFKDRDCHGMSLQPSDQGWAASHFHAAVVKVPVTQIARMVGRQLSLELFSRQKMPKLVSGDCCTGLRNKSLAGSPSVGVAVVASTVGKLEGAYIPSLRCPCPLPISLVKVYCLILCNL